MLRTFGFKPNHAVSYAVRSAELITGRGKRDVRPIAHSATGSKPPPEFLVCTGTELATAMLKKI